VGQLTLYLRGLVLLLLFCSSKAEECSRFKSEFCSVSKETVLLVDRKISGPMECQAACFEKSRCVQFSFFSGDKSKCVLFKSCIQPMSSCANCISGPVFPRVGKCFKKLQRQRRPSVGSSNPKGARQTKPNPQSSGFCVVCVLASGGGKNTVSTDPGREERDSKDEDETYADVEDNIDERDNVDTNDATADYPDDEIPLEDENAEDVDDNPSEGENEKEDDTEEDDVNIDDGLLDDVFEDLPGSTDNDENDSETKESSTPSERPNPPKPRKRPEAGETKPSKGSNGNKCPTCFYYCIMGGGNNNGAVPAVSIMDIGTYRIPSRQLISPFPAFMTRGSGRTFSAFSSNNLMSCTPGYEVTRVDLLSGLVQSSHVPGSCNQYDFRRSRWFPSGGESNTFRSGGSSINVGRYIMSLGGFDPFGQQLRSVELFDPRRPQIGWQTVPQWSFPRATMDQCSVQAKDPEQGALVMVMGGLGEERSVSKLVLSTNKWYSVARMIHPRSQHGCMSVTLNGRPGLVVSGGVDNNNFNTSSVEFFDMRTNKWINLPSLSRGRRGHTMRNIDGQMVVAGGQSTGLQGEEEYLDDVEVFDGRQWKTANYRLDQPRSGANIVKIPVAAFRSN